MCEREAQGERVYKVVSLINRLKGKKEKSGSLSAALNPQMSTETGIQGFQCASEYCYMLYWEETKEYKGRTDSNSPTDEIVRVATLIQ